MPILVRQINRVIRFFRLWQKLQDGIMGNFEPTLIEMVDIERDLKRLPPRQFSLLLLFYGGGYSIRDCVSMLGFPERTLFEELHNAQHSLIALAHREGA